MLETDVDSYFGLNVVAAESGNAYIRVAGPLSFVREKRHTHNTWSRLKPIPLVDAKVQKALELTRANIGMHVRSRFVVTDVNSLDIHSQKTLDKIQLGRNSSSYVS
jgi:hypothetical protein